MKVIKGTTRRYTTRQTMKQSLNVPSHHYNAEYKINKNLIKPVSKRSIIQKLTTHLGQMLQVTNLLPPQIRKIKGHKWVLSSVRTFIAHAYNTR